MIPHILYRYEYIKSRKKKLNLMLLWEIYFWIFLLLLPSLINADREGYRTAYGCEGESLSIQCEAGQLINVIRANYGRFSITICNDHGNTEWSVNCHSPKTYRVLTQTCTGRPSCTIEASTIKFGDGCPGTRKYLEAHYQCLSGTSTTTMKPLPPWFLATQIPAWFPPSLLEHPSGDPPITELPASQSTTTVSLKQPKPPTTTKLTTIEIVPTTKTFLKHSTSHSAPDVMLSSSSFPPPPKSSISVVINSTTETSVWAQNPSSKLNEKFTLSTNAPFTEKPIAPTSNGLPPKVSYDVTWCPPTFTRGLMWNWTESAQVAELPCPGGATGLASRRCILGEWSDQPDLSDCRSAWLTALEKRGHPNTQDSALAVAIDLSKVTNSKALYGGDLIAAARLIKRLSSRMRKDVTSVFPEPHQKQALVTEFLMSALNTASSLLRTGLMGPWGDLSEEERREAVTALLVGLEEAAFLLANSLSPGTQAAISQSHVLASARSILADGSQVQFPSTEDRAQDWSFPDSFLLPPEVIYENSDGTATRVVFLAYRHLEDLLAPTNTSFTSRSKRKQATYVVNSRVVSASLGHGRHIQISELSKPVLMTFALLRHENVSSPICVFWDFTTFSWSDEGCLVLGFNKSHVTCRCDHLTHFAVLMEEASLGATTPVPPHSVVRILTFVGCLVCLVGDAGAILLFALFKGISSRRTRVHRHVCVCLFVAELAFLVGIWRTDAPILCGVVAGILLYSVVATFAWLFAEGAYIYFSVTHLLELDCVKLRWWHYVVIYGSPALVVAGAAIADPFSFGSATHCWLETENYFILALVIPVLILLAMQLVLLGASLVHTCKFNSDCTLKTKEMSLLSSTRSWMKSTIILTLLMVLTWVLGLLLLHQPTVAIAAAFCTCNALQGIFIFMYYCIINQKYVPSLCNTNDTAVPSITHFPGGTYMVGSQEGSCTPPPSALTRLGHSTMSAPLAENISYKSFSRDSGHGGSEQEDSPRTPWTYQHRYDLRTKTLGGQARMERTLLPNSYSFSLLSTPGGERRPPPWGHHYTEIDPVYEEVVGGARPEGVQVSDLSDEDNSKRRRLSPSPRGTPMHRLPPIGMSPLTPQFQEPFFLTEETLRNFNQGAHQHLREDLVRHYLSSDNVMTVAVLNGEQVVCRLSSPTRQLPPPQPSAPPPGDNDNM